MDGNDGSGNGLPVRVERAFAATLDRYVEATEHAEEIRRELRALFLKLTPSEANAVVRRSLAGRGD